jgi:hypothetical protein
MAGFMLLLLRYYLKRYGFDYIFCLKNPDGLLLDCNYILWDGEAMGLKFLNDVSEV